MLYVCILMDFIEVFFPHLFKATVEFEVMSANSIWVSGPCFVMFVSIFFDGSIVSLFYSH